jgi:NNP family nitrate/nitrite transporter-like MFS transporter
VGWHAVFGLALLPVVAVLGLFALLARDAPNRPAPKGLASYAGVLGRRDAWWFCAFYAVTFGGFVGLASFLPIFFRDQYALGKVAAGNFATLCVVAGSFLRPLGGYLADRFGGVRVLVVLFLGLAVLMSGVAAMPPLVQGAGLLFLGMAALGLGNGAVFQLVPNRFPREIGVVTGLVGAVGGLGGFALPNVLGGLRQASGHFGGGFAAFALAALMAAVAMAAVGRAWQAESETTFTVLDDAAPVPGFETGLEAAS